MAWKEKLNIKDDKYNLSFRLNQSHPFLAWVWAPYLLPKGPVQWHPTSYSSTCECCTFHTCVDFSMFLEQGQQFRYQWSCWGHGKTLCDDHSEEACWENVLKIMPNGYTGCCSYFDESLHWRLQQHLEWHSIEKSKLLNSLETGRTLN